MNLFIKQYGLLIVYIIVGLLLITVMYVRIREGWRSIDISDSPKTAFSSEVDVGIPMISGKDRKFRTGTVISDVRDLIRAEDGAGNDIAKENFAVKEIEGKFLRKNWVLDGSDSGISRLCFTIKGANGKTAQKELIVLFDVGGEVDEDID